MSSPSAPRVAYDPHSSLRDARAQYFRDNGFGDDGGYSAKLVHVKVGPIPFSFPNTPQRIRAVRYHDLHHVLTGYRTDFVGEAQISAWEIASGCRDMVAAWILNLGAMAVGMLFDPRAVFRAFVRGRHTQNLYGETFDEALLDRTVGATREQLAIHDAADPAGTAGDAVAFVLWLVAGTLITLVLLAPGISVVAAVLYGIGRWLHLFG
jgi:hypothetical protein